MDDELFCQGKRDPSSRSLFENAPGEPSGKGSEEKTAFQMKGRNGIARNPAVLLSAFVFMAALVVAEVIWVVVFLYSHRLAFRGEAQHRQRPPRGGPGHARHLHRIEEHLY